MTEHDEESIDYAELQESTGLSNMQIIELQNDMIRQRQQVTALRAAENEAKRRRRAAPPASVLDQFPNNLSVPSDIFFALFVGAFSKGDCHKCIIERDFNCLPTEYPGYRFPLRPCPHLVCDEWHCLVVARRVSHLFVRLLMQSGIGRRLKLCHRSNACRAHLETKFHGLRTPVMMSDPECRCYNRSSGEHLRKLWCACCGVDTVENGRVVAL